MKKFLSILGCFMLVIFAGISLVGCGGKTNDFITPSESASFSGSDIKFTNTDSFKLEYMGDNHYKASGEANVMSKDQAKAWGTLEGSYYVVVNVKMGKDGKAIIGWREPENKDKVFLESEIDGSLIKRSTAANDTKNYILAITDAKEPRHPEKTTWRIEVTKKDAEESEFYTIDFSALYDNLVLE